MAVPGPKAPERTWLRSLCPLEQTGSAGTVQRGGHPEAAVAQECRSASPALERAMQARVIIGEEAGSMAERRDSSDSEEIRRERDL